MPTPEEWEAFHKQGRTIGQPEWDNNDYQRDFTWLGIAREGRMEKPSIGRMVHFVGMVNNEAVHQPAVITAVNEVVLGDESVDLIVLERNGIAFRYQVYQRADAVPDTWHWPERV